MSILSELKKLTGKNKATVISEALPPVLPIPSDRDVGKCPVVKADGTYEFSDAPFELPEVSSADAGKGLFVDSNGTWGKEYPPRQVPQPGNDDDGKYLMVAGGQYVFEAPSGNDGGQVVYVHKTQTGPTDKTWNEIRQAIEDGNLVVINIQDPNPTSIVLCVIVHLYVITSGYKAVGIKWTGAGTPTASTCVTFTADTADDYLTQS